MAAADHQFQMLQRTQVFQWVVLCHNKICALARLNGTGHVPYSGQLSIAQGGRVQGELVAYTAVFVEVAQLRQKSYWVM